MFKYRIYIMKFKKSIQYINHRVVVVNDAVLLLTLTHLQEKYDFKIIKIKFNSHHYTSYIVIKCKKEDKYKIFADYCASLNNLIETISI